MRSALRSAALLSFLLCVGACTPATPPVNPTRPSQPDATPPVATAPTSPALPSGDPFALQGVIKDEVFPLLKSAPFDPKTAVVPPSPAGVAAVPATCDALTKPAKKPLPRCDEKADALTALDAVLAETDATKRDVALAGLEACRGFEPGLIRALRVEFAPPECGDVLTLPLLQKPPAKLGGEMYNVLLGQTLAARLARTALKPPALTPPFDKKRVQEFTKGPLVAWITEQTRAVEDLGRIGTTLSFYARSIVAVEAGMTLMRLVEVIRSAPVPEFMQKDAELKNVYYGTLDQLLEPWKDAGRDAALVGLRDLSSVGVLRDRRVTTARTLLSRLYGGRRIDALDMLLVPPLPAASPSSQEERLAMALPTYYAGVLLPPEAATRPGTLRMLIERGLPMPQRVALKSAELSPELRLLDARGRLDLGRLYWRAVDFDQAATLLQPWPQGSERPAEATFVLALAIALRNGPEDAAMMMRRAPLTALGLGELAALDWVARSKPASPYAGIAAFNAALIKQLSAPQGAPAAYWLDVAARFQEAKGLLTDPSARALADERARAAEETAKSIK